MQQTVYFNGRWLAPEDVVVPFQDRGFMLGDGLYEVVRVYDGVPYALEPHMQRLERGARAIELPLPVTPEKIENIVDEAVRRLGAAEAQVYVQVTRGVAPRVHHFPEPMAATLLVQPRPAAAHPRTSYKDGVATIVVPDERWLRCDIKSINLLPNVLAKEKARRAGVLEALLERDGVGMTEGSSSNLFIVREGQLITAPANGYILHGVTRQLVLDDARAAGIPVKERFFTKEALYAADEVFMTSTLMEVMPVTRVDGHVIGDGVPGPITRRLGAAYKEGVERAQRSATETDA